MDLVAFRAERDDLITKTADTWDDDVQRALAADDPLYELRSVAADVYASLHPGASHQRVAAYLRAVRPALAATDADADPTVVAEWMAVSALNYAAAATAKPGDVKRWVTMRDDKVRAGHAAVHGEVRALGGKFLVMGQRLRWPGEPVGDPSVWINCRCLLAVEPADTLTADGAYQAADVAPWAAEAPEQGDTMTETAVEPEWDETEPLSAAPLTWHGVLAPEGEWSGDKRRFANDAMTWRDLPLPLSWQKVNGDGHSGSVVVGQIQTIERVGNLLMGTGTWASTPEADEVIGLLAEGHLRGVSVDVDDADITMSEADNGDPHDYAMTIDKGRICGATICAIPAFAEAYITLGQAPVTMAADGQITVEDAITEIELDEFRAVDPKERRRMAEKGHALPDGSFPIATVQDLKNAIQAIGRAKDPAAARAHIKKRANALGHPELIPDSWSGAVEEFSDPPNGPGDVRGPGWVTEPKATRRIHAYWTTPGEPGFAKIRWGEPGDFNRCREHLAKYVSATYLNRTCAEWHNDALGYWPAQHNPKAGHAAETVEASVEDCDECSQSVMLVASAADVLDAALFADPALPGPTALTIDGDRVFGHLALWDTCHIGFGEKVCVTAPHSEASYAYFTTGSVLTTDGRVSVGQITMNTGHADHQASARGAAAHYDHTGAAVADVAVGEDEHGIWFSGALRPTATEAQRHALGAAALSGDWRGIRGNLELVAALAVNVPGFPVPRVALAASGGEQTALVAAGLVQQKRTATMTVSLDVEATAKRVVEMLREDQARTERARSVAADAKRLRLDVLSERV